MSYVPLFKGHTFDEFTNKIMNRIPYIDKLIKFKKKSSLQVVAQEQVSGWSSGETYICSEYCFYIVFASMTLA